MIQVNKVKWTATCLRTIERQDGKGEKIVDILLDVGTNTSRIDTFSLDQETARLLTDALESALQKMEPKL